jgi:hypothetical protein
MSKHHTQMNEEKTNNRIKKIKPYQDEQSVLQEREDLIRKKAYELHEQSGFQHGRDMDDWLEAEKIGKSHAF